MEDGMSSDEGFKPTTPEFRKDETQPIPLARRTPTQMPTETPTASPAVTETAAPVGEATQPTAQVIPPQPTPIPRGISTPPSLPPMRVVATPPSLSSSQMRLERSVRVLWMMMAAVTTLALVSLAINVFLITRLMAARNQVAAMLDEASRSLDNLTGAGLSFDFPVSQTVPFEGDVPFKQDINFPFKGNIPIDTTISVPVDMGLLGKQVINVPVKTTVPVDITIPVHIEQTFHVKTQVPVKMNVPIRIGPNDPPLRDLIAQIRQWLARIRQSF
jgi:hypothetical protein